jgi:hypothetical protein
MIKHQAELEALAKPLGRHQADWVIHCANRKPYPIEKLKAFMLRLSATLAPAQELLDLCAQAAFGCSAISPPPRVIRAGTI